MDRVTKSKLHRNEAIRLKQKWHINAVQVRYRETGDWYAPLKHFPAALLDLNGYILFPTEQAYRTPSPHYKIYPSGQIGFLNGISISKMPGYRTYQNGNVEDSALIADIKQIESRKTTDSTTKQALVNARIGQGKFGSDVRTFWNYCCSVTGASTTAALEASHIKRWVDSSDNERLDPNNGLLLTANLHKLFDAGLVSFDDSGIMLVSSKLSPSECEIFGVVGKTLSKTPSVGTTKYLLHHRTITFLK